MGTCRLRDATETQRDAALMREPQAVGKDRQPSLHPVTLRNKILWAHPHFWLAHTPVLECTKFPRAGLGIALGVIGIPASWFPEKLQPAGVCPEAGAIMVARVGLDPADWTIVKALGYH